MIYLASPYSHPERSVREARFQTVCKCAAAFMRNGHHVFSPIAHSHPIAQYGLSVAWEFWKAFDLELLAMCDSMIVLKLDGWETSDGLWSEIEYAKDSGKPIVFRAESEVFDFDDNESVT